MILVFDWCQRARASAPTPGVNASCHSFIGFKGAPIVLFISCASCKLLRCVKVGDDYSHDSSSVVIRFMPLKICCSFLIFISFHAVTAGYLNYLYRSRSSHYGINKNKLLTDL